MLSDLYRRQLLLLGGAATGINSLQVLFARTWRSNVCGLVCQAAAGRGLQACPTLQPLMCAR